MSCLVTLVVLGSVFLGLVASSLPSLSDEDFLPHSRVNENCNGGNGNDLVESLPGLQTPGGKSPTLQYSGYIEVDETYNGNLFYWFFEAVNPVANGASDIPLLVWLNGGPGASSLMGLFVELGLYELHNDYTITLRNDTWNDRYHLLFVDNPVQTGYSFVDDDAGLVTTSDELGAQFAIFLKGFYDCHPEYANNPLYITGESCAGRYIPFIGKWILKNNLPLAGLAIGNGHYDPNIQYRAPLNYALMTGVMDTSEYESASIAIDYCLDYLIPFGFLDEAADLCSNVTNDIYGINGGNIDQYDIRQLNGDFMATLNQAMNTYCNRTDVKQSLHTTGVNYKNSDGTSHPNPVYEAFKGDLMLNNSAPLIPKLLDAGVRILFYNGQFDGSVWNNYGNAQCLEQMNYKNQWIGAPKKAVFNPEIRAQTGKDITMGYVKQSVDSEHILTYFVVSDSGHLAPYDQPYTSKYMIETWIERQQWV